MCNKKTGPEKKHHGVVKTINIQDKSFERVKK